MSNVSRETLKPKVACILGQTASGKTGLAVKLAGLVQGEIISVDSRQVYKGMDIGTGKDLSEYGTIPYHLIDIKEPSDEFAVSDFKKTAEEVLLGIIARGKTPIFAGGSAYYLKALIDDYHFEFDATNREYTEKLELLSREDLEDKIIELGLWKDHHWGKDSKRRMARAIEKAERIQRETQDLDQVRFMDQYDVRLFYTDRPVDDIRERIKIRLEERLDEGMIEEVQWLLNSKKANRERLLRFGLEYKWICLYLDGEMTLSQMKEKLFTEICRFAKRQRTFLRYMQKQGHQLLPINNRELWLKETSEWLLLS